LVDRTNLSANALRFGLRAGNFRAFHASPAKELSELFGE
jgi:hypothetical protein